MAEERKHTNTYSAADIEKYWTGKLTPAEMHAMEKAALDDPFLADAMEGYSTFADGSRKIQNDIAGLRADLETRIRPSRQLIIMNWWKLAGAAMIIISLGTVAYFLGRKDESHLAMERLNKQEEQLAPAKTDAAVDSLPGYFHDSLQNTNTEQASLTAAAHPSSTKSKVQPKIASKIIHGVVRDTENQPVAGASVALQGKTPGLAITDSAGRFRLPAGDSTVNLDVASVGYANASRKVEKAEASKEIQIELLRKDAEMQEVVVTGYATKKNKRVTSSNSVAKPVADSIATGAEPVNGWEAFRLYLESDKKVPDSLKAVHGVVELEFSLNRFRKVSEIKVIRSLHPALDSQAVKLLENGPRWKPLVGKRTGITVRIGF
jgi:hypothetical protein